LKLYNSYAEVLIDNQRDTFTEPFEISTKWMIFGLDTVSTNELWDMPKSLHSYMNRTALIQSSVPSLYVDFSLPLDSSPAVSIPKYNNYPIRKQNIDDITRAVIPLKSLGVKTLQEIATSPITTSFHKPYQQNALIGYAIFPSLGLLLPGIIDSTVRHRFGMPIKANSPIFMLTIKPANNSKYLSKSIHPKLHFRLRTLMREGLSSPQCAYWAFSSSSNSRQKSGSTRGRWSSKGCEVKGFHPPQKYKLSYDYINCSCDRAIGIAVLMDVAANEYYLQESLAQVIASYTGVIISLILLATTLFLLSVIRGLETNSNSIHRNLVLCLFLAELIFLIALRIRGLLVQKEVTNEMIKK
jgi:cadherin EGF LAG seven-pass G-type receptor 1